MCGRNPSMLFVAALAAVIVSVTAIVLPESASARHSLWGGLSTPANVAEPDAQPVELGIRFSTDLPGVVSAVRFYKGRTNTGPHQGSLWAADGTRLATATFTGETAQGW